MHHFQIWKIKNFRCINKFRYWCNYWSNYWRCYGASLLITMTKNEASCSRLPTSSWGYDTLGEIQMGTSRSVESMKLKQSQEIELARSISEIGYVSAARVHLAIPEKSVFVRDTAPVTASVFVQLLEGRALINLRLTQ